MFAIMERVRKIVVSYAIKKHLGGKFYIVEFYRYSNENGLRKRKLKDYRNLTYSEAEVAIYKLESKIKTN